MITCTGGTLFHASKDIQSNPNLFLRYPHPICPQYSNDNTKRQGEGMRVTEPCHYLRADTGYHCQRLRDDLLHPSNCPDLRARERRRQITAFLISLVHSH